MNPRFRIIASLCLVGGLFAAAALWQGGWRQPQVADTRTGRAAEVAPSLPEGDPFARAVAVLRQGAGPADVEETIAFFDTAAREGPAMPSGRRAELVRTLAGGAPSGMSTGTWAHLFNSACNALAAGGVSPDPAYLDLLIRLAAEDRRLEIRLYALQHLGARYGACGGPDRERVRKLTDSILAERPVSPVAGTALVLARRQNPEPAAGPGAAALLETARLVAADASLPVDVRVTALHTAGEDASVLETARALAADTSQPAILRKAAIHLLGRHGTAADLPLLRRCSGESPRLAQAGDPAASALQARLTGTPDPVFHPY